VRKQEQNRFAKNVLMNDGTPRRLPADECVRLVNGGQAKRFISNTVYKALKLGIEVKDPGTRDGQGVLRSQIAAAREAERARRQRAESKKKPEQESDKE